MKSKFIKVTSILDVDYIVPADRIIDVCKVPVDQNLLVLASTKGNLETFPLHTRIRWEIPNGHHEVLVKDSIDDIHRDLYFT